MSRVYLLNHQPWRFEPGDYVYVRSWPQDERAVVLCQLAAHSWPHYLVMDSVGIEWRVSQLELSSRPIVTLST